MIYLALTDIGYYMGYSSEETATRSSAIKKACKTANLLYKSPVQIEKPRTKLEKKGVSTPTMFWDYGIKAEKPPRRSFPYVHNENLPIIHCYSFADAKHLIKEHLIYMERAKQIKFHPTEYVIGKVVYFKPMKYRILLNFMEQEKYTCREDGQVEYCDSAGKTMKYLCLVSSGHIIKASKSAYKFALKKGCVKSYDFEMDCKVEIIPREDSLIIKT